LEGGGDQRSDHPSQPARGLIYLPRPDHSDSFGRPKWHKVNVPTEFRSHLYIYERK
jgi:hypothetical protein